jgi:hypothetical protein
MAEAATIGRGFEAILRISTTPAEAVDKCLSKYPALSATAQQHLWFRPMLETIVKRLRKKGSLGMRLRLACGAGLTIADMASDIASIVVMFLAGQSTGAYALLSLILLNVGFQLIVATMQNSHRDKRNVAWEIFLVLSLFKGGVDAIRLARGDDAIVGSPMDPLTEMIVCKVSELVFESIPGAVLQAIFLLSGGWTTTAMLSIAISCLSTAFTATLIAYDLDTNLERRGNNPEFFGCAAYQSVIQSPPPRVFCGTRP